MHRHACIVSAVGGCRLSVDAAAAAKYPTHANAMQCSGGAGYSAELFILLPLALLAAQNIYLYFFQRHKTLGGTALSFSPFWHRLLHTVVAPSPPIPTQVHHPTVRPNQQLVCFRSTIFLSPVVATSNYYRFDFHHAEINYSRRKQERIPVLVAVAAMDVSSTPMLLLLLFLQGNAAIRVPIRTRDGWSATSPFSHR